MGELDYKAVPNTACTRPPPKYAGVVMVGLRARFQAVFVASSGFRSEKRFSKSAQKNSALTQGSVDLHG
jgi:hypothetical protein